MTIPAPSPRIWRIALVVASLAALALLLREGWRVGLLGEMSIDRVRDIAIVCAFATAFTLLLVWRRRLSPAWACAGMFALVQVMLVGVAPLGSVMLLLGAAVGVGTALVPKGEQDRFWLALVCGIGIVSATIGWLLPFKLHFAPFYAFVLGSLVWWRRRELRTAAGELALAWRPGNGGWIAFLAVLVVSLVSLASWVPTSAGDDLGYHLGLPWELVTWHRYRMDVSSQVWAVSAWAGDIVHAIAQLLAGREARAAVNLLWLVVAMHLLHRVARNAGVSERGCWWVVALAASQPMTLSIGLTMQVELPSTAVLLAMIVLAQSLPATMRVRHTLLFATLAGFALALKVSNVVWVGLVSLWYLARAWPMPVRAWLPGIVLAALVGGSSYFYAMLLTGNPVLPLFNTFFKSPDYPIEPMVNALYVGKLAWDLPLRMLTDTGAYQESYIGAAGFQIWLLLPAWLLALRDRALRPLASIALAATVVLLVQVQYLRYVFPLLVLATVPMVGALERLVSRRAAALTALVLVLANVAFLFNVSWQLRTGPWQALIRGPDAYLAHYAPERLLIAQLRARGGDYYVFFGSLNASVAAELAGRGTLMTWYDPEQYAAWPAVVGDPSGGEFERVLRRAGATHVIVKEAAADKAVLAALARIGTLESRVGVASLYRLEPVRVEGIESATVETPGMRTFWFDLSGEGPFIGQARVKVACAPTGRGVRLDWLWFDGTEGLGDRLDYGLCDASGWAMFERTLRMPVGTDRVRLRTMFGDGPQPEVAGEVGADMDVRRDLTTARDRSGKIGG